MRENKPVSNVCYYSEQTEDWSSFEQQEDDVVGNAIQNVDDDNDDGDDDDDDDDDDGDGDDDGDDEVMVMVVVVMAEDDGDEIDVKISRD